MSKSCADCIFWEPDLPEVGHCGHDRTAEFGLYVENALSAGAEVNADDCPGFEDADEPA